MAELAQAQLVVSRSKHGFRGLDVVALRDIAPGEELTLDDATFCNETMSPFDCYCGSPNCPGRIESRPGASTSAVANSRRGSW